MASFILDHFQMSSGSAPEWKEAPLDYTAMFCFMQHEVRQVNEMKLIEVIPKPSSQLS
jgi:phage terminase large subunit GpA-like protein